MLKKTDQINEAGKDLYLNTITGQETTLKDATFFASSRKAVRGNDTARPHNERKATRGRLKQYVDGKVVYHETINAIFRKSLLAKKLYKMAV